MPSARAPQTHRRQVLLGLAAILALALFLRLFRLSTFPPGLYPDVAVNGLDALHLGSNGPRVFYNRGNGNEIEGMIVWLDWLMRQLVGREPIFLYATTVVIGVLTIPVQYLLGARLFSRRVGLLSAALLAVSFWDVHFSRIGYRTLLVPLFVDLVLLSGVWAVRRGGTWRWVVAGAVLGVGNYTYTGYRLVFVALAVTALVAWRQGAPRGGPRQWAAYAAAALVLSLPFLVAVLLDPHDFFGRTEGVSVLEGGPAGLPLRALDRLGRALGMFNVAGDPEKQYDVPHLPMFDPLAGSAFIAGLVVAVRRWRELRFTALLTTLVAFTLVVGLSDRTPHVLRASGVVPVACLLAAVGLDRVAGALLRPRRARLAAAAVVLCSATWTGVWYFAVYPTVPGLASEFNAELIQLGRFMVASDFQGRPLYVVETSYASDGPHPDNFRSETLQFETDGRVAWTFLAFSDIDRLGAPRPAVIYDLTDVEARIRLARRYPGGRVADVLSLPEGHNFAVFVADGGDIVPRPPGPYRNT